MNPYDFVPIDWSQPPERHKPAWHHRLSGPDGQKLYAGQLELDIYIEKPLFIFDPRSVSTDPRRAAISLKNGQGEYIIPGSNLKGMIRGLIETLGHGCLTLFDGDYERGKINYQHAAPQPFQHCENNTNLCIACRICGMIGEKERNGFLGKIHIGDARVYPDTVQLYDSIYTQMLMEPKPHHASFYLEKDRQHIAGRKYYFHHADNAELLTADGIIKLNGKPANKHIQPLDYNTRFHVRIDFTNLEQEEFAVLLLACTLEEDMRHKIGYGKPLGLGTVCFEPTRLKLIDYTSRYQSADQQRGIRDLQENEQLWDEINKQTDKFLRKKNTQMALEHLRRIWRWPADESVIYKYPDKANWFDTPESINKRIADTRSVP